MLGRIAMSLLGGTGAGAALMYLLDPDTGEKHRARVRRTANNAYDAAAVGWDTFREQAGPVTTQIRGRLSDRLADASRAVAPGPQDYEYEEAPERIDLSPIEARTALALSRHSRDLYGDARDVYARARDMYYDALVDLDMARTHGQRFVPKQAKRRKAPTHARAARSLGPVGRKPDYLTISLVAAGCLAAGAATMFILDPSMGRRRRARVRDKAYHAAHVTSDAVRSTASRTAHYVRDRGQGTIAHAKSVFHHEDVPDDKLVARVRSEMGRVVSSASAIEVRASNGSVTLKGAVPPAEFDALMKCVYSVPGVREVINQTDICATADDRSRL